MVKVVGEGDGMNFVEFDCPCDDCNNIPNVNRGDVIMGEQKKKKSRSKCAPFFWRKYSPAEKKLWNKLYRDFNVPENFPTIPLTKKQVEIVAHNLAIQALDILRDK